MFRELNFLFTLGNARASAYRRLIQQATSEQVAAIGEIMRRLAAQSIIIYQPDLHIFEDQRLTMRTIASGQVNRRRKKNALLRHRSLLTRVLRSQYIYQTIAKEISDTIYMGDE